MNDSNSCLQIVDIKQAITPFPKGTVQVISVCLDHVQNPQQLRALWKRTGATWQTIVDPLGPDSDAARTWRTDTPGGIVILSRSGKVQSIGQRSTDITDAVTARNSWVSLCSECPPQSRSIKCSDRHNWLREVEFVPLPDAVAWVGKWPFLGDDCRRRWDAIRFVGRSVPRKRTCSNGNIGFL